MILEVTKLNGDVLTFETTDHNFYCDEVDLDGETACFVSRATGTFKEWETLFEVKTGGDTTWVCRRWNRAVENNRRVVNTISIKELSAVKAHQWLTVNGHR